VALANAVPALGHAADGDARGETPRIDPAWVPQGLQLGARIGYSLPAGRLALGSPPPTHLSDLETASVPIAIDAGFRFSPRAYLGGTIAWGPGIPPNSASTCPAQVSCFRQNAELRLEARLYFLPEARAGWWTAIGAGWEIASFAQTYQGHTVTATFTGPVFADLQLGYEWRCRSAALGPYFGFALAEFLTEGVNPAASPVSTWIPNPGPHTWVTIGLRGSYGPW
jgi:hypothetical protein